MPKCLRAMAAILAVVVALTGLPATPAAASGWPVVVGNSGENRPSHLMVNPINDQVYVCGYDNVGDMGLLGLNSDGSQFLELTKETHYPDLCHNSWYDGSLGNIDANGVVYGTNSSWYDGYYVIAYDAAAELWATQLESPCGSTRVYGTAGPFLASDGKLYMIHEHYCGGFKSYLTRLDASTGQEFDTRLLASGDMVNSPLRQYEDGFVLQTGWGSSLKFHFYEFSDLDNPTTFTPSLEAGESAIPESWGINPSSGELYLVVSANHACHDQGTISSVISYDGQSQSRYDVSAACLLWSSHMDVTPTGVVVAGAKPSFSSSPLNEGETKLVHINHGVVGIQTIPDPAAYNLWRPNRVRVDMHGNVLIAREYDIRKSGSYTNYRHTEFLLYSADGMLLKRFSTEALNRYDWYRYQDVVLVEGEIYALMRRGSLVGDYEVYQWPMALAGFDYPRGTLIGVTPEPAEPLEYVALGDSYSSGEGTGDYYPETDIPDENDPNHNKCHRSPHAYPELLASDPMLPLNQTAFTFVACSGAETPHVIDTAQFNNQSNPQGPQYEVLSQATKVVTVSIGGNDAGFGDVAEICNTNVWGGSACAIAVDNMRATVTSSEYADAIALAHQKIADNAPNADVYVIGYPHIFPEPEDVSEQAGCSWFSAATQFTDAELYALRDLSAEVNSVIEASATSHGFTFIDMTGPFSGREACTDDPLIYNVNPSEQSQTYHPTPEGQALMARVVRNYMLD